MSGEAKGSRTQARITASEPGARPAGAANPKRVEAAMRRVGECLAGAIARAMAGGPGVSTAVDGAVSGRVRGVAVVFRRAMLVTAVTTLATACAARAGEGNPAITPGLEDQIEIRIINNNFSDARMYAVRPGAREYIGRLTGKTEANYTLDWDIAQTLSIEISLLAGGTCTTEELIVDPGEALFLSIDSTLATMTNCRRTGTGIGS